jgi:hypothetical protein
MDRTPEYMKMSDCPQIQGTHNQTSSGALFLSDGDDYAVREDGALVYVSGLASGFVYNYPVGGYVSRNPPFGCAVDPARELRIRKGDAVWLPHQDELQEMYGACNHVVFLCALHNFAFGMVHGVSMGPEAFAYPAQFRSMEQLTMALVMQERHGKHWTGEAWV